MGEQNEQKEHTFIVECQNPQCKQDFPVDFDQLEGAIVASGKFKVRDKKRRRLALNCPHCGVRNIVEVTA